MVRKGFILTMGILSLALTGCHQGGGVLGSLEAPRTPLFVQIPTISYPRETTHYSRTSPLVIQGLCNSGYRVLLTGADFQTTDCVDSTYSFSVSKSNDGIYPITIAQSNAAGTSSPSILFWVLKNSVTAPSITSPNVNPYKSATSSINLAGGCESGATIELGGQAAGRTTCMNSTYSLPVYKFIDGVYNIQVTQTDLAGNSASTLFTWEKESLVPNPGAPQIKAGQTQVFQVSGGSGIYNFSFVASPSGASFDVATKTYTAGPLAGVVDILRIEDSLMNAVEIPITVVAEAADHFVLPSDSGSGQQGPIDELLTDALKVRVVDKYENPVANFQTEFIITGGDASLIGSSVLGTDAQGYAQIRLRHGRSSTRVQILAKPLIGVLPNEVTTGDTELRLTTLPTFTNAGNLGTVFNVGAGPVALISRDFDGDGRKDVRVLNSGDPSLGFLRGRGDGLFDSMSKIQPLCLGPNDFATGDFNADSHLDFAIACPGADRIAVVLSQADGSFLPVVQITPDANESLPVGIRTADFDGDGKLDLVTTSAGGSVLSLRKGNGDGTFTSPTFFNTGAGPSQLAIGDLNKDGKIDAVTVNGADSTLSIFINDGLGGFLAAQSETTGSAPVAIAMGDLNGDLFGDLVIVNNGDNNVYVLLNDQYDAFMPAQILPVGLEPKAMLLTDLDADGALDLIVTNGADSTLSIMMGQGDGSFLTLTPIPTKANPVAVTAADFNGDTFLDLVVATNDDTKLEFFAGNPSGQWGLGWTTAANPSAVKLADLDEDGINDILLTQKGVNNVAFLKGTGRGTYTSLGSVGAAPGVSDIAVADLNLDDHLDFVIVHENVPNARVYLGNGDGTFNSGIDYSVGSLAKKVLLQDLNSDGFPEIIVANSGGNSVSILTNAQDGTFAPKLDFGVGAAPVGLAVVDLNGDGEMDILTANNGSGDVSVLLSVGGIQYLGSAQFTSGGGPSSIVSGYFNSDGNIDIAVANEQDGTISVLLGEGDGSLLAATIYSANATPLSLITSDFNGDGRTDLAVANGNAQSFTVLFGSGTGLFNNNRSYATSGAADVLSIGDVNRDSAVDILVLDIIGSQLSTWLGH